MERKYLEYFDGAFDSTVADKMKPENKPYVAYSKTEGIAYTVVPKIEGVYYDITELVKKNIPVPSEGYGEVDLGLSVKWADRNVGAENPWDNGAYFSWGNIEGVVRRTTKISEDDAIRIFLIMSGVSADTITQEMIDNIKLEAGEYLKPEIEGFLKENILISGTTFDENTYPTTLGGQYTGSILDANHDAATANMGEDWRMPTSAETLELVENTDHYYIDKSGKKVAGPFDYDPNSSDKGLDGSKLRSICFVKKGEAFDYNVRGNFIEFPFAGFCINSLLRSEGLLGRVWSSSVSDDDTEHARFLSFSSEGHLSGDTTYHYRYGGQSVRGVHPLSKI